MKLLVKSFPSALFLIGICIITFGMLSCTKTSNDTAISPPSLVFKTGPGFIYKDTTVPKNSALTVGIQANKTSKNDILIGYQVTCSFDGKPDSVLYWEDIYGASVDSYNKGYPLKTRNQSGSEKYTFSVITVSGLKSSLSVSLNVN